MSEVTAQARAALVAQALLDVDAFSTLWDATDAVGLLRAITRTHIRKLLKDEASARRRLPRDERIDAILERLASDIELAETLYLALGGSLDAIATNYVRRTPE